jgi:hypothetical protein
MSGIFEAIERLITTPRRHLGAVIGFISSWVLDQSVLGPSTTNRKSSATIKRTQQPASYGQLDREI